MINGKLCASQIITEYLYPFGDTQPLACVCACQINIDRREILSPTVQRPALPVIGLID
jgi:hypothetical protein